MGTFFSTENESQALKEAPSQTKQKECDEMSSEIQNEILVHLNSNRNIMQPSDFGYQVEFDKKDNDVAWNRMKPGDKIDKNSLKCGYFSNAVYKAFDKNVQEKFRINFMTMEDMIRAEMERAVPLGDFNRPVPVVTNEFVHAQNEAISTMLWRTKSRLHFVSGVIKEVNKTNDNIYLRKMVVVLICIANYEYHDPLLGAKLDRDRLCKLFRDEYNYTVFTNDKLYVTNLDVEAILQRAKQEFRSKPYDGIIVLYSGHGSTNYLLMSDYKNRSNEVGVYERMKFTQFFNGNNVKERANAYKLYFFDACNGDDSAK